MDRMKNAVIIYPLLCFFSAFILPIPSSAFLPYTPSHIFLSPRHNNSLAYLLLSDSFTQNRTQFLSLNISGNVDAANPKYSVLLEDVPFHGDGKSTAFVPVIDRHGTIKVYAGDCHDFSNQGFVWQFDPDDRSPIGNGTWNRHAVKQIDDSDDDDDVDDVDDLSNAIFPSANCLASGFTYASTNKDRDSLYTFGGMCPLRTGSDDDDDDDDDADDGISSAYYSQSMTTILDPESSSNDTSSYRRLQSATTTTTTTNSDLIVAPAALAGSSITPLQATYATTSATGDVRIEQSFLLLGGHSQHGPVNMSRVTLFALPQNNWNSFDTTSSATDSISGSGLSDLAVRDDTTTNAAVVIGPRSGHSAVLSPDGSKVIVFGGWVGNTSTPADPLLAVLDIGRGYGGSGPWAWKNVPSMNNTNDSGLSTTTKAGIFGHGATMLPGGMMMVAGGYTIPPRDSSKRSTPSPELNSQVLLYNVTSSNWATSYANPSEQQQQPARTPKKSSHSGPLSSTSKKTGLGVGIGVGIPVVAGIALSTWLYARRRRSRRTRDQTIRNLALGAERFHFWNEPNMSSSFRIKPAPTWSSTSGRDSAYPWACNQGNVEYLSGRDTNGQVAAEETNLLGRTGNREPSSHRQYSNLNRRDTAGHIHTIDEREEEEASVTDSLIAKNQPADQENLEQHTATSLDLLSDGRNSIGFGPIQCLPKDTNHASRAGLSTGENGDNFPNNKNDRTTSNLSDSSTTGSALSAKSRFSHHNNSDNNSSNGQRATTLSNQPVSSIVTSTHHSSPDQLTPPSTGNSMTPAEKHDSADSFTTALTGQSIQQAESENLLGGGGGGRHSWQWQSPPGSPSKRGKTTTISDSNATKMKDYGFIVGTVRRALTGVRKGAGDGLGTMPGKRYPSAIPTGSDFNGSTTTAVEASSTSSYGSTTLLPRRAVSASAELYRRKQGAKDWGLFGVSNNSNNSSSSSSSSKETPEILFSRTRIPRSIPRETALVGLYERQAQATSNNDGNGDGDDNHDTGNRNRNGKGREEDVNHEDEEDWDVEAAAEGRRVQVTFTVPKEKLRVVNATAGDMDTDTDVDMDGSSSSSSSSSSPDYDNDDDDDDDYGKSLATTTATTTTTITGRRSVSK